jgi:hypothetical protein
LKSRLSRLTSSAPIASKPVPVSLCRMGRPLKTSVINDFTSTAMWMIDGAAIKVDS